MSAPVNFSAAAQRAGFDLFSPRDANVERALRSRFEGAAALGTLETTDTGFSLQLNVAAELPALHVEMQAEEGWLSFVARLERSAARFTAKQLLEANVGLPGGVKLTYAGDAIRSSRPELRAEVPLSETIDLDLVLGAVIEGFVTGARRLALRAPRLTGTARSARPQAVAATPGEAIPAAEAGHATQHCAQALADAGWMTSTREDGRLFVDLEVGEGYRQALLEAGPEGELRLGSALPEPFERPPSPCADALALAALLTSRWVRTVRAVDDGALRLEVPLSPGLGADAAPSAARALSVALRLLGEEAEILARDRAVASHYVRKCTPRLRKRSKGAARSAALSEAES